MIKLTMTEKGGEPKALSFDKDEVTIGRVSGNDIVLPKGNVSKRHSRLLLKDGRIEISDLKSTNGTYVNGKKIAEATMVGAADRVYVGDFLITIDGLGGELAGASASRRMPPPPPPPRATGSTAAKLPDANEATNTGAGQDAPPPPSDDEEDFGLAAKPPRAGRVPPPPPPPPRRPPTPISSRALDDDEEIGGGDDLAPPSPSEISAGDDSTNNVGLFERRKTADHAALEAPRPSTGSRAAMLPAEPAPLPAVPGQATTTAADFLSAAADAAASGEGLEALLTDPGVTQIVIAGPDATFVDRGQGLTAYAPSLGDPNTVADTLWRLANSTVPPPAPDNPIVDVRFPDGTRLSAVFPPVSPSGVVGSIRRPLTGERALVDLLPPGAKDVQTLLEAAIVGRRNVLLTGDVGALPTLAAALASLIPGDRRVVSIGGQAARPRAGWTDLQPSGDIAGLVRVAASLRAEHLLLGDTVGPEVADLLFAAARGQEGLLVAVPARTVGEGLTRVEALTAPAFGGGATTAVAPLVASTIDLAVHIVANADGTARVVDIAEPKVDGGRVGSDLVASWRSDSGRRGEGAGKLQVTGVSARLGAALGAVGQSLPGNLVRR